MSGSDKRALRRTMRARLASIPAAQRTAAGRALAEQLVRAGELAGVVRVACYAALPEELPTEAVFAHLWSTGRRVYLPRIRGARLEFAPVASEAELETGRLGIREPEKRCRAEPLGSGDLVLVPGLAFDRCGRRLGRGGGYYDRTFPPAGPAPRLVGVAFACQLVAALPEAPHDRRVAAVVTEREFVAARTHPADQIR